MCIINYYLKLFFVSLVMITLAIIIFIDDSTNINTIIKWCQNINYNYLYIYLFLNDKYVEEITLEELDQLVEYDIRYEINYYNLEMYDYYYHYISLHQEREFDIYFEINRYNIEDNLPNIDTILEQMIHYNNKWLPLYLNNKKLHDRNKYPLMSYITYDKQTIMNGYLELMELNTYLSNQIKINKCIKNNKNDLFYEINTLKQFKISRYDLENKVPKYKLFFGKNRHLEYFYLYLDNIMISIDKITSKFKIKTLAIQNYNICHIYYYIPINNTTKKTIELSTHHDIHLVHKTNYYKDSNKMVYIRNTITKIYLVFDGNNTNVEDMKHLKTIFNEMGYSNDKIASCYRNQMIQIMTESIKQQYNNILILDIDIYFKHNFMQDLYHMLSSSSNQIFMYIIGSLIGCTQNTINNQNTIYAYILTPKVYEYIYSKLQSKIPINAILEELYLTSKHNIIIENLLIKKNLINKYSNKEISLPHTINLYFDPIIYINKDNLEFSIIQNYILENNLYLKIFPIENNPNGYQKYTQTTNKSIDYYDWCYIQTIGKIIQYCKKNNYEKILILDELLHIYNNSTLIIDKLKTKRWELLFLSIHSNSNDTNIYLKYNSMINNHNGVAIHRNLYDTILNYTSNNNNIIEYEMLLNILNKENKDTSFIISPNLLTNSKHSKHYHTIIPPTITVLLSIDNETTIHNLKKTIKSIKDSSYKNIELIILDNKHVHISNIINDETIIYYKLDKQMKWYNTIQYGIKNCKGCFISFIRSNYTIDKDRFIKQLCPHKYVSTCNINNPQYLGLTTIYNKNILLNEELITSNNELELFENFKKIYHIEEHNNSLIEHIDSNLYYKNIS